MSVLWLFNFYINNYFMSIVTANVMFNTEVAKEYYFEILYTNEHVLQLE